MFLTRASRRRPDRRSNAGRRRVNFDAAGLVSHGAHPYNVAMQLKKLIIAVATIAATSSAAVAGDASSQSPKGALPGVTGDYRIAKPAPQPEPDDALPASGNGTFKIGNTDVQVSGTITID